MFLRLVQQSMAAMQARLLFGNEPNESQAASDDDKQNVSVARQLVAENPTIIIVVASGVGFIGSVLHTYGYSAAWGVRLWALITPGDYLMQAVPIAGFLATAFIIVLFSYVFFLTVVTAIWVMVAMFALPFFAVFWGGYRLMRGSDMDDEEGSHARSGIIRFFLSVYANITAILLTFFLLPIIVLYSGAFVLLSHPGGPTVVISLLIFIASLIYLGSIIIGLFVSRGSIAARVRATLRRVGFYAIAVALLVVLPVKGANDFYAAQYKSGWQRAEQIESAPAGPLMFPRPQKRRATPQSPIRQSGERSVARTAAREPVVEAEPEPTPQEAVRSDAPRTAESAGAAQSDEFAIEPPPEDADIEISLRPERYCVPRGRVDDEAVRFDEPCLLRSLERGVLFIDGGRQKVVFDFFDEEINIELCYPNAPPDDWADFRTINTFIRFFPWLRAAYEYLHYEGVLDAPERRDLRFGELIDCQGDA